MKAKYLDWILETNRKTYFRIEQIISMLEQYTLLREAALAVLKLE